MLLARIVGTVVATRKDLRLISYKLLRRLHRQQDLVDNGYLHSSRIDQESSPFNRLCTLLAAAC